MSENQTYDVAIIGAGIVGAATALALSEKKLRLAIVEAESDVAQHQTGHNSGVIHSGLYYKPGSLKARLCVEGREKLIRFCQEEEIPFDQCGKIVVATHEAQLPALSDLERRGVENGLHGMTRLDRSGIAEREPHASGIAGLHVPQTGIVDYTAVTRAYVKRFQKQGGDLFTRMRIRKVVRSSDALVLESNAGALHAKHLINCAGLQSDRVAKMCGVNPNLQIVPFRGEYYELVGERHHLVNNLIYPVPDPRFPFLGVHFTRMIQGGIEAGPNAVLALRREGYGRFSFSLRDTFRFLLYRGFWKMALRYWRTGFGELYRSFSKRAFVKALRSLLPELTLADVKRSGSGVRAQALEPNGQLSDDFRIVEAAHMFHVLNAPSPAATASLAIGKEIADRAMRSFSL